MVKKSEWGKADLHWPGYLCAMYRAFDKMSVLCAETLTGACADAASTSLLLPCYILRL